MHKAIIRKQL